MERDKIGLGEFIHQVTDELIEATEKARRENSKNLVLSKVEIVIATEVTKEGEAGLHFSVVDAKGRVNKLNTHSIKVELVPYVGNDGGPLSGAIVTIDPSMLGEGIEAKFKELAEKGQLFRIALPPIAKGNAGSGS